MFRAPTTLPTRPQKLQVGNLPPGAGQRRVPSPPPISGPGVGRSPRPRPRRRPVPKAAENNGRVASNIFGNPYGGFGG